MLVYLTSPWYSLSLVHLYAPAYPYPSGPKGDAGVGGAGAVREASPTSCGEEVAAGGLGEKVRERARV